MSLRLFRFWLGRHLIHLGLRALPAGRCKDEIFNTLAAWSYRVECALTTKEETHEP
jgi:hypothetical protein